MMPGALVWHVGADLDGTYYLISDRRENVPTLYVFHPDRGVRHAMSYDIALWLNGGFRPAWMADMEKCGDYALIGCDGAGIRAYGPRPGSLDSELQAALIENLWVNQVDHCG